MRFAPILHWLLAILLLRVLGCSVLLPPEETSTFPPPADPAEAVIRERFLTERLDAGRLHAQAWYWGWTAINGGSTVFSAVSAARTKDTGDRAYQTVQASFATLGLADVLLLRPMPGRQGADPMRGGDPTTRLARGERVLVARAQREAERTQWPIHVANLALQLLGAGVLLGFGQERYAALSFGIGMVSGEAYIWSEPWSPERDLHAYRQLVDTHGATRDPPVAWRVVPAPGGLALRVEF